MPDERYTFETARIRLEEIATEVRKKDTSLEKSLDLLEEGVRLANICTELVDHTDLSATVVAEVPEPDAQGSAEVGGSDEDGAASTGKTPSGDGVGTMESPDASDEVPAVAASGDGEGADTSEVPDDEDASDRDSDDEGDVDPAGDGEADHAGSFDDTEDELHEPGESDDNE